MGDIHWFKDVPKGHILAMDKKTAIVTQELFDRIGDYTRSMPTSPSAGRIYKKLGNWAEFLPAEVEKRKKTGEPEPETFWWVFYVMNDPMKPGWQMHIPRRLLVMEVSSG